LHHLQAALGCNILLHTFRDCLDTMSQKWLSFNEAIAGKNNDFGLKEDDEDALELIKQPLKFLDTWVLWEQVVPNESNKAKYADNTRKVTKITTLQDFWAIYNGIPQPSELLEQKQIMREQPNGTSVAIDAIMIFKEGIAPEWEHPANASGGHFQIALKPNVGGGQIDEFWNNLVLAMVGGTLEPRDIITGIRLVDKLSGNKMASALRIELWFTRYENSSAVNTLRRSMEKCLNTRLDGTVSNALPKADIKKH